MAKEEKSVQRQVPLTHYLKDCDKRKGRLTADVEKREKLLREKRLDIANEKARHEM